jgi:lipopolysaccharide heptosyltransferase II
MKILIVKIGAVGDVAMALSMVEALKKRHPGCRITWLCGRTVEPLLGAYGKVDEIISLDDAALFTSGFRQKCSVLVSAWLRLLFRPFDLVLTGHSDLRYELLSLTVRGKVRRSFGRAGRKGPLPGRFHGDEYVRLALDGEGPDLPKAILPRMNPPVDESLKRQIDEGAGTWVALAPGGAKNLLRNDALRRWPIGHYVQLAEKLSIEGFRIALTGSESDGWVRDYFAGLKALDLIGKTSLPGLIAFYGRCRLVVAHDSGPMHLAALAGTPVLAFFGPTIPHEKASPDGSVHALWGGENLACRPCYDGKDYADCRRNRCLEDLGVEEVFREARTILGGGSHSIPKEYQRQTHRSQFIVE